MSDKCGTCPVLRAENSRLQAEIRRLQTEANWLRRQLNGLFGGIVATIEFVARERQAQKPTIPRSQLLPHVMKRLAAYIDTTKRGEW
jgi:hypothetical protein